MGDAATGAMAGVTGTLVIGFLANFVSEDYRRFRDGKSLAGAIAGELSSYAEALPMLEGALHGMLERLAADKAARLPKIEKPTDRVFDGSVAKLGLLGNELVEEVVYVYNNINAFRTSMALVSGDGLTVAEQAAHV